MSTKTKLVEVTDNTELDALHQEPGSLDVPLLFSNRSGDRIHFWADADELRAWRQARSTHQSEVKP